jgi:hypothetical protein
MLKIEQRGTQVSDEIETKEWLSISAGPSGSVAKAVVSEGNLTARATVKAYEPYYERNLKEARAKALKILAVLRKVAGR